MARVNRPLLFRILSDANHIEGHHIGRFLANVCDYIILRFPERFQRIDRIDPKQIGSLAEFIASSYDMMDEDEQSIFIDMANKTYPVVNWSNVLRGPDETADEIASSGDFDRSDGPERVPEVGFDQFRRFFEEVIEKSYYHSMLRNRFDPGEFLATMAEYPDQRRTIYWTMQIFAGLPKYDSAIARMVPGLWQFAVGFFNPVSERDEFGLIALSLVDRHEQAQFLEPILINEREFPVVVRPISVYDHSLPTMNPIKGTAACWATSRINTNAPRTGILTAKHVAGRKNKTRVKFPHGSGRIIDLAPEGIDAALVDSPETFNPSQRNLLPSVAAIAQWADVEFKGASSGPYQTKVTATTDQLGIYNSPLFPVRVLLAKYGKKGDSGALIYQNQGGQHTGVGLYMGKYKDAAGRTGGLAQHIKQVTDIMDMELYQ